MTHSAPILRASLALAAILCLLGPSTQARANMEIQLGADVAQVAVGETIDVAVELDTDDTVLGGGFQIEVDPNRFEVVSFSFSRSLGDESQYRCGLGIERCGTGRASHVVPVGFGRFDGLTGQRPIGVLRLRGVAAGQGDVVVAPYSTTGGFVDLAGSPLETTANTLTLDVVPEPGVAALLAVGVPGLVALGRRRR